MTDDVNQIAKNYNKSVIFNDNNDSYGMSFFNIFFSFLTLKTIINVVSYNIAFWISWYFDRIYSYIMGLNINATKAIARIKSEISSFWQFSFWSQDVQSQINGKFTCMASRNIYGSWFMSHYDLEIFPSIAVHNIWTSLKTLFV